MKSFIKIILIVTTTVILSCVHCLYSWAGGLYLYERSGGVTNDTYQGHHWERFGGAPYAWTIPLELPGCAILIANEKAYGRHSQTGWGALGALMVLFSSVLTSYAIASSGIDAIWREQAVFGKYHWKLGVIILGLIWIPVPEWLAWVYQYTVIY